MCFPAISETVAREPIVLHEDRIFVVRAENSTGFANEVLPAKSHAARWQFAGVRRWHRAPSAMRSFGSEFALRLRESRRGFDAVPFEVTHRICSFASHIVASSGPNRAKKFSASLKSKKSLRLRAPFSM